MSTTEWSTTTLKIWSLVVPSKLLDTGVVGSYAMAGKKPVLISLMHIFCTHLHVLVSLYYCQYCYFEYHVTCWILRKQ